MSYTCTWTYKCIAHQLEDSENRKEKTPNHMYMYMYVMYIYRCVSVYVYMYMCVYCMIYMQVSSAVLCPHIPELVKVLLECFRDDSWLVRDGMFTVSYI